MSQHSTSNLPNVLFNDLLPKELCDPLAALGYETPTPIQAMSIPILMAGEDLLAQAQTGTGKTAAFALPILARINLAQKSPQAIIITPTRELAIQVAEAFQSYAKSLKGFQVTPIYGGQEYRTQLKALKRGAHVIVGTPGRVMDHLRRGTLKLNNLQTVILDEADEMLKMGFIDDIEWILEQIPQNHQTGLFSATMPFSIKNITKRYLKDAKKVHIKPKESTVSAIEQVYTIVSKNQKLDTLTRFLEVEDLDAVLIFVRTKNETAELAQKLNARGYACAALNGDMNQSLREKVVNNLKKGTLDIVVATDVAARGIDVSRISHVINYDIPYDTESYIHRIGRTGRAGREGKAILFVTPREMRMLRDIERVIRCKIPKLAPPSYKEMNEKRSQQLTAEITTVLTTNNDLKPYRKLIGQLMEAQAGNAADIAAALAYLLQETKLLPLVESPPHKHKEEGAESEKRSSFKKTSSKNKKKHAGKESRYFAGKRKSAKKDSDKKRKWRK